MSQLTRQVWIAVLVLISVIAAGTIGYVAIEGWSVGDSLYMTVITVTTVGFGEIHPLSEGGKLFTGILILSGFSLVAYFAGQMAQFVLDGDLRRILWKRKMKMAIEKMNNHYIICGYGRVGEVVCEEMARRGQSIVVIESDPQRLEQAKRNNLAIVDDDALTDEALLAAGIKSAAGLVTALFRDSDNLLVTLSARELNHRLFIISRGESDDIESKLLRAGADKVVSPYKISGERITRILAAHNDNRFFATGNQEAAVGGYRLQAVYIHEKDGRKISDVVKEAGADCAVAMDRHGESTSMPSSNTELQEMDQVVLLVKETAAVSDSSRLVEEKKISILVADDHDALRKLFVKKLHSKGFDVIDAPDGKTAVEMVRQQKPDIAILDAMMPGKSGFDVCAELKAGEDTRDVKVVIFSNMDIIKLRQEGEKCGADKAVQKSATSEELLAVINEIMQK